MPRVGPDVNGHARLWCLYERAVLEMIDDETLCKFRRQDVHIVRLHNQIEIETDNRLRMSVTAL